MNVTDSWEIITSIECGWIDLYNILQIIQKPNSIIAFIIPFKIFISKLLSMLTSNDALKFWLFWRQIQGRFNGCVIHQNLAKSCCHLWCVIVLGSNFLNLFNCVNYLTDVQTVILFIGQEVGTTNIKSSESLKYKITSRL